MINNLGRIIIGFVGVCIAMYTFFMYDYYTYNICIDLMIFITLFIVCLLAIIWYINYMWYALMSMQEDMESKVSNVIKDVTFYTRSGKPEHFSDRKKWERK